MLRGDGAGARLGVAPAPPSGSFPLGIGNSHVAQIGTNIKATYMKTALGKTHASSQKFTNSFNPDHFLL